MLIKIKEFVLKYYMYLILAALIYQPIFGHLGTLPIRPWDEARLAINAYEMYKNGDYIVTHFDGTPEMWNTKPPLLIWMQVLFMKLIGVNELSVRLPSAFAAFFTCLALLIFFVKYLKQFWFAFISVIVLVTIDGYIDYHATRTGDYDSLLTLLTTVSGLFFFIFIEKKENKYLYLFFISTALAVLTKSVQGLLFIPAIGIYCLWQKEFLPIIKNKHFYLGLISFLIISLSYYWIREIYNPGYIKSVFENELGGRYLVTQGLHAKGFWYYYSLLLEYQLKEWYLLVPCGILIGFSILNDKINKITLFSTLMVLTYFLVVSNSQTKTEWYDVPLFPFLSILISIFIYYIFDVLRNVKIINYSLSRNWLHFIFMFLILILPYQKIIQKTYIPKEYSWNVEFFEIGHYLKDAVKEKHSVNNYFLLYDGYNAHNKFYLNILNDNGVKIEFKDWTNLNDGDKVIVCQQNVKEYINNNYLYEVIENINNISKYRIISKINK